MIDGWTISLASALVVVMTAALFIGNTISLKDSDVGRIWSGGYLAGVLTTLSFLVWASSPDVWWASAVGNASFVVCSGLFWAGCRRLNRRPAHFWFVALVATVVLVAALLPGPEGGLWAGARAYFVGVALFGILAGLESLRGSLRTTLGARILTVVFWIQATFFLARLLSYTVAGPDSMVFEVYFGTSAMALITMVTVIALTASMTLIRSNSSALVGHGSSRGYSARGGIGYTNEGLLTADAFEHIVRDWLERAEFHDEQLAFFHCDLDDLAEINTAFGQAQGNAVLARYADTVRRYGPPHSDIGVLAAGRIVVVTPMSSADEALAAASAVQTSLLEDARELFGGVRPTLSIGIALTDFAGFDYDSLSTAALEASKRASRSGGNRAVLSTGTFSA